MEMVIDFPGGAKVDAHFSGFTVKTDQPPTGGGEGSAPAPFGMFLASIGTCAGYLCSGFLQTARTACGGNKDPRKNRNQPVDRHGGEYCAGNSGTGKFSG